VAVDGIVQPQCFISLVDDRQEHHVELDLG
jgi:hypothetical protein